MMKEIKITEIDNVKIGQVEDMQAEAHMVWMQQVE